MINGSDIEKIDKYLSGLNDQEAAAFLEQNISDEELGKNSVPVTDADWKEMLELARELRKYW